MGRVKIQTSFLTLTAFIAGLFLFQTALMADDGGAIVPLTLAHTLPPNDDGSTGLVPLGIGGENGINFFGQNFTQASVNNNGNLTFVSAHGNYTPNGLQTGVGQPIIAPFFADVDTNPGGLPVMYGNAMVQGYNAFVANYIDVAYYAANNKHNNFQVILLDRSDTGAGNFDIEFNYGSMQWETGSASGGDNGLGGISAVAGYSNGLSGNANVFYQLPGSLVNGALIDGGPDALMSHSLGSSIPGRYIFQVRNGIVVVGPAGGALVVTGMNLGTIPLGSAISGGVQVSGGSGGYVLTPAGPLPPGISVSSAGIQGTPTQPGPYSIGVTVTDSSGARQSTSFAFSVFGFTGSSLPPGVTGSPYSATVSAAGGTPPYKFTISGLPAGLTANSAGYISGISNVPVNVPVSVTATENNGDGVTVSGTQTLVIAVPPPLRVPTATLPAGIISSAYSAGLTATGGAPPYTWTMASGTLPRGLSLRSTGTITGLPSQTGTYTIGVRAADYTGASAVGSVTLTINPLMLTLSPSSGALAGGMATVEYPGQTLMASGGMGPYRFTVSAGSLPAGLTLSSLGSITGTPTAAAVGTASFTVMATDTIGSTASAPYTIVIRAFASDLLVSSGALSFNLNTGSAAQPPAQPVTVQSTTPGTPNIGYTVSVSPASATWVSAAPAGTTPGTVNVSLTSQATALAASTTPFTATVNIQCQSPAPCGLNPPQPVSVSLMVTSPPPALTIDSNLVAFTVPAGAPQPLSQSVGIRNSGGGSIGFQPATCAASWCNVTGTPGSLLAGVAATLTVNVDPTGLMAGYYRTTVSIACSVGTYVVPVTVFIAGASSMALEPAGAQFQVSPGGTPNGPATSFLVNVSGNTPVTYTAAVQPGANWLTLTTPSGSVSASAPSSVNFGFNNSVIAGMQPGAYYGTILVTITGLVNSPQVFEVVLNVLPPTVQQRPQPMPAGLLFITGAATAPPSQSVSVSTASTAPVVFQSSASSTGNWLQATPVEGTATPGSPSVVQVSVNPANLQPGIYFGTVSFAFSAAAVRSVNVTLIVTSTTTAHDLTSEAASGCTATQMVAAQTGLLGNFAAPVAWPTPLTMQLVDNCGNFVTNGQIVATFSNGDPPLALNLADPRSGYYAGTWTPRNSSPQVSISARATAPGLPAFTALIAGSVTTNAAPVLSSNSTLHIFNPLVGAALAPGTLVDISGSGLSTASATAPSGAPLPTTLAGTQAIVGGTAVPLQSVSPTMITAELPFELLPGQQYQVLIIANGGLTTPDTIQLAGTSPGVATATAGLVNAFHSSGAAVTEAAPAMPGEQIYLLAAGLGATDTQVPDGAPTPATPAINVLDQPTMTINNEPATISFAGLQPGAVGVYQVTFTVPTDAANGDLSLVLTQDGNPANSGVLPVHN